MADNQEQSYNGEDSQELNESQNIEAMNGGANSNGDNSNGGENHTNGSAEAPGRDDDRKLFVGGLSWETTEKELRDHFGAYGEIESINVKTDPTTGRSRGFAFIVYGAADSIDKVVAAGDHIINNKKVDPKKAKARTGKIFVGGLIPEISDDEIKAFFGQFGNIVEVEMPFDKQKNQRKAFCFITFDSEQVVNELLKTPKQTISGKEVDVKKATPKPDGAPVPMGGRGGGRSMGRGRGRGGSYGQSWGYNQGYGSGNYGGQGYSNYGDSYGSGGYDYYGGYGSGSYGGGNAGGYGNDYSAGGYGNYDGVEAKQDDAKCVTNQLEKNDFDDGYGYDNYGVFDGYGGRSGGHRSGKGGGNYQGGKQRGGGGGRQPRHQPY